MWQFQTRLTSRYNVARQVVGKDIWSCCAHPHCIPHLKVPNILGKKHFQGGLLQFFLNIIFLVPFIKKYRLPWYCQSYWLQWCKICCDYIFQAFGNWQGIFPYIKIGNAHVPQHTSATEHKQRKYCLETCRVLFSVSNATLVKSILWVWDPAIEEVLECLESQRGALLAIHKSPSQLGDDWMAIQWQITK